MNAYFILKTPLLSHNENDISFLQWYAPRGLYKLQRQVNKTKRSENIVINIEGMIFSLQLEPYLIVYHIEQDNKRLTIALPEKEKSCIVLRIFKEEIQKSNH